MPSVRNVSVSALLAAAIACITAGINLIESDLYAGIVLIVAGVALGIIYTYLLEKQIVDASLKTLRRSSEG